MRILGGGGGGVVFFFKILPAAQNFGQNRVFVVLWESSENQFGCCGRSKKKIDDKIIENSPPPPRENPRSDHDNRYKVYEPNFFENVSKSTSQMRLSTLFFKMFLINFRRNLDKTNKIFFVAIN